MVDPQSNINCKKQVEYKLKILIKNLSHGTTLRVIPPGMSVLFAINWLMTSLGPQLAFIKKKNKKKPPDGQEHILALLTFYYI